MFLTHKPLPVTKCSTCEIYLLTSCFQLHVTTCWCKHKKNGKIQEKLKKKKIMDNIYLQEITQHFGLWHDTRFL